MVSLFVGDSGRGLETGVGSHAGQYETRDVPLAELEVEVGVMEGTDFHMRQ